MRNGAAIALLAMVALPAPCAWAQGIGIRTRAPGPMPGMGRQVTITVPVEVRNFPPALNSAIEVVCVIEAFNPPQNAYTSTVAKGSALLPFSPGPGNDSYQGSVTIALTVPGGTIKPKWICSFLHVALPATVRLDNAASVQTVEGLIPQ
jgi:hypothetical protein